MTGTEEISIDELVRILVKSLDRGEPHNPVQQDSGAEEILFDVDVDGTRYLLIRFPKPAQPHAALSPREQEIVRLVALGHSNKIIAGVLNISSWTVCTHVRRIFTKLGVGSRAAMVARASEIERMRSSFRTDSESPMGETNSRGRAPVPLARNKSAPVTSLAPDRVLRRSS